MNSSNNDGRLKNAWIAALAVAALAIVPACVSGGSGDSTSDGGSSASSGGSSGAGGGKADGSGGGTGGDADASLEDAGPTFALPTGCAPAGERFVCNPLSNEGCSASESCDYGLDEYFTCFPGPNEVDEDGACDYVAGPYCKSGLTCDTPGPDETAGVCKKHCCSNDDCPSPQTCAVFDPEFGTLGVCRSPR